MSILSFSLREYLKCSPLISHHRAAKGGELKSPFKIFPFLKILNRSFYFLFCLLLIGLPFSKALLSLAFVGLVLVSMILYLQNKIELVANTSLLLPILLFLALSISVSYSHNYQEGFKVLSSQIKWVAIPFIFIINRVQIQKRFSHYVSIFLWATTIAALLTFILFLLPNEWTQQIAASIPLLKPYILREKALAFGIYSPFTERLQFSYVIGIAIFLLLWKVFETLRRGAVSPSFSQPLIISSTMLLILLVTLLILGARGAQIGFIASSVIWLIGGYLYFIHPILSKKWTIYSSYSLLIIGLIFSTILLPYLAYKKIPAVKVRYEQMQWELATFENGTFREHEYLHFTSIRRLLSWKNSWAIIKNNPMFGVGIGDYQSRMAAEYEKDDLGFPVNTQSQFLYYWASAGLLGLGSFLIILGFAFLHFYKQEDIPLKLIGMSTLTFYSLIFLFDAPLNFQVGSMTFLTIYCLLLSLKPIS